MTEVGEFTAGSIVEVNKKLNKLGLDSKDIISIRDLRGFGYRVFYHKEITNENSNTK